MDPIEEKDGQLNPLQNRVSVDNQTDINSSAYAEKVQSDIAEGDEKLGKEINDLNSSVKETINNLEDDVRGNAQSIEEAAKAGEDARAAILDTVVFNAGDESDELTSSRLKSLITEFKDAIEAAIETVKSEESTDREKTVAEFFLTTFGEVYSPLGFQLWQLKDYSSVEDDLDSVEMEKYESEIENLRGEIAKLMKAIADLEAVNPPTPESEEQLKKYQQILKDISVNFERWTDANDATPDAIETRITTLEKGLQWRFDADDNAMDAFKEDLMKNVIGVAGEGEYYRLMKERFEVAAEEALITIDEYEAAEDNGEPISDELRLEKAKADYFVNNFGTTASVVAVKSLEDYHDSYKSVQWNPNTYNEYLNDITKQETAFNKWEAELAAELKKPEGEIDENRVDSLKKEIKSIKETLTSITCESGLNPYQECLDGYVHWYVTKHDNEFNSFKEDLMLNVIGVAGEGEYYRLMKERFEVAAEEALITIDEYEAAEDNEDPISPEMEAEKAKADFFVNNFGTTASVVAIKSFEDYNDAFNSAQWDENTYSEYLQAIAGFKSKLENTEDEQEIKDLTDIIKRYTCVDSVSGEDIVCLDGYFAWYVFTHDSNFENYIVNAREENGFNPSTSVDYLTSKKESFQVEMEDALLAIDETPEGEEAPADAMDFVNRFGRIANSQTAFHNWLAYKAEGRVSEAVGEILHVVECVNKQITDELNDKIVTTSTEVASYYPLADGSVREFTLFGTPDDYKVSQAFINGIATNFTANEEDNTIDFGFAPHAGASLTILVESRSRQNISYVSISDQCLFELPEELTSYDSYECDAVGRQLNKVTGQLSQVNDALASDEAKKTSGEETKSELETLENKFSADQQAGEAALQADQTELETEQAKLTKSTEDEKVLSERFDVVSTDKASAEKDLEEKERKDKEMGVSLEIKKLSLSVEEARPFPDEDKVAILKDEIAQLKIDREDNQKQKEALKSQIDKLTKDIDDLDKTLMDVRRDVADSQSLVDKIEESIRKTAEMLKLTSSNISLVKSKLTAIAKRIQTLTEAIEEHKSESASYNKKSKELMAILKSGNCGQSGTRARAAIAHNDDTFELMDENLDIRALNEDGTEMEP